jgi:hypothetical protein
MFTVINIKRGHYIQSVAFMTNLGYYEIEEFDWLSSSAIMNLPFLLKKCALYDKPRLP